MPGSLSHAKRWTDTWLHSDLIGIPVTLAGFAIIAISFALYLLIGNVGGLFVGKLLFIVALGGLLGLILLLEGRHGQSTAGISPAPAGSRRRVLVVANEGLENPLLCNEVCGRERDGTTEVLILAPVVASSWLHVLTDVDPELRSAQARLDAALDTMKTTGISATGHTHLAQPRACLLDGLREFPATDVVMLRGCESGWADAELFAQRVKTEVGLSVTDVSAAPTLVRAA
jgi:hypothetical protein